MRGRVGSEAAPNCEGRDPLLCQPNQISVFSLLQQSALPADLALRCLGPRCRQGSRRMGLPVLGR